LIGIPGRLPEVGSRSPNAIADGIALGNFIYLMKPEFCVTTVTTSTKLPERNEKYKGETVEAFDDNIGSPI